ncbi:hypothetical protein [Bradyrhizobium sp. NAS80.1]|uniref:hypothetical protein n=1 Tax=Bradyrhizobium sp. NAS80.1 TaxID=1680159 RepID=UPI0011614E8B|nr:hypothetical protein [Bradyrhizobium sp. NAS80.1]
MLAGELELALPLALKDVPDNVLAHAERQLRSLWDGDLAIAGSRDLPGAVEQLGGVGVRNEAEISRIFGNGVTWIRSEAR